MKRKTMLLAAAALSVVAFAALPSMASAFTTTPVISLAKYPQAFTGSSGAGTLFTKSGRKLTCESSTQEGEIETGHTGWLTITFKGCKESTLGSKCTTAGFESGHIMTEKLLFHTVYTPSALPHEKPAIVITPNATTGKFATFNCAGGLVKIEVTGNGVLGMVTEPAIGGESNTMKVEVNATEAGQEGTETWEGEKFGLESSTNGGAMEPAYENAGTSTLVLSGGVVAKTTTETP